jgi:hypothetical protein
MRKRRRKSKRANGSQGRRGTKNYDVSYHYIHKEQASQLSITQIRERNRQASKKTRNQNRETQENGYRNSRLTDNLLGSFIPSCAKRKAKVRRDYFSFKKARPNLKIKHPGQGSRFNKGVCK